MEESSAIPRRSVKVPIKIWLEPRRSAGALESSGRVFNTFGETSTLSMTGVAFVVPSIRIHENYLVGDDRVMTAELDLPEGRVRMKCVGQRYDRLEGAGGSTRYLVGVKIVSIPMEQRATYEKFVNGSVAVAAHASLALGVDQG